MSPQAFHLAVMGGATFLAGYLMTIAGVHKNTLEWRRRGRRCPSCGRDSQRSCRCR
jgi:hypothetical protein